MNTILKFSRELAELVGRKWQMAPNRMFQQLTDETKKKNKKFSSDDGNESLQSFPPSLTGFNIQASVTEIATSESRESPQ